MNMNDWLEKTVSQTLQAFVTELRKAIQRGEISEEEAKSKLKMTVNSLLDTLTEIYGREKAEAIISQILSKLRN